jgi:multiple sugar transport system permease protein
MARSYLLRLTGLFILLVFTLFFIVPIVWLLLASTKTDHQLITENPFAFGSTSNFAHAWHEMFTFQNDALLSWLKNSAVYSFGGVALALITSIPAGYGLARTKFIGRRLLLAITMIVMIIPSTALVLPLFLEVNVAHLTDTAWSVILPFALFPFGVFLAYIYYASTIPEDLFAAARIDGCTEWQVFRKIALPLSRPIVALVAFFAFVANWNNFYLPFVMLPDSTKYPVQVGLEYLLSSTPAFNPANGAADQQILRPEVAIATLVSIAPVLIIFMFAQRTLVSGMLAGATKE